MAGTPSVTIGEWLYIDHGRVFVAVGQSDTGTVLAVVRLSPISEDDATPWTWELLPAFGGGAYIMRQSRIPTERSAKMRAKRALRKWLTAPQED